MRCSHCRQEGHNRSRCPELPREEKSTERFCSFCAAPDHNRASCTAAKREAETLCLFSRAFRSRILDGLDRIGMGPGAIIEMNARHWPEGSDRWPGETVTLTGMVTGYSFIDNRTEKSRNRWRQAQSPSALYLADPLSLFPGRDDLDEPWEKVSVALGEANPPTLSKYDVCRPNNRKHLPVQYVAGKPTINPENSFNFGYRSFHNWSKPFSAVLKILSPTNYRLSPYSVSTDILHLQLPPHHLQLQTH